MKYVRNVRGRWVVRMTVPEELRAIIGQRELVEIGLPSDATSREKQAVAIINAFHAKLDEAREVWESLGEASRPTLSSAAKEHYLSELEQDDLARATSLEQAAALAPMRTVYANKLRLLVAGKRENDEAEALMGYAADDLKRKGRAPQVDRPTLLRTLAEIQLQALEAFEERDAGKLKLTLPSHPLLAEPDPIPKSMPAASAPKTINMKWLSHLSSILQWASNNGQVETNPAQGVMVDTGSKVHREPSYLPFTKDELKLIFGTELFRDPSTYGLNQWALLVMLFTGVRNSSEMARMKLTNIYTEQGVPVFYLAEASKNQRSKRLVPIHDDLVKLGLLDHVAKLREKGQELLFPEWAARPDKVNDWFNNGYLVSHVSRTAKIATSACWPPAICPRWS